MKTIYFLILTGILVNIGCQKDIGLGKIDTTYESQIFIEGILSPGEVAKIYISHSLSFFHEKVNPQDIFARHAEVELISDNYAELLQPDSIFDKFRCRWTPFYASNEKIEYGSTYRLSVTLAGDTYTASTSINQAKANIDSVTYIENFYDVYGGHDGVIVNFKDTPNEVNNYRFQMDRVIDNSRMHAHVLDVFTSTCTQEGEPFSVTDLGRTIFADGQLDDEEIKMYVEVSFEYLEGDSATIFLQSLDQVSATFFRELDSQLQAILNPFVEPVFLHSTIDGAFGVFGSAVKSDPVFFVYPQDNP